MGVCRVAGVLCGGEMGFWVGELLLQMLDDLHFCWVVLSCIYKT